MIWLTIGILGLSVLACIGAIVICLVLIQMQARDQRHLERRVDGLNRTREVNRFRFAVESPASDFRRN
jgi:hypothetical protein